MTGTVWDESGAVLPGVSVTVTQTDTGFTPYLETWCRAVTRIVALDEANQGG